MLKCDTGKKLCEITVCLSHFVTSEVFIPMSGVPVMALFKPYRYTCGPYVLMYVVDISLKCACIKALSE